MPPPLIKGRYGEPILTRIYNNPPVDRTQNGGFGRNETQLHFHNAHNGAESDGAANAHHFPGTFYDYRWSTTLARRDTDQHRRTDQRASGPDGNGGLVKVPGDFRELQGTHVVPRPPLLLHRRERLQGQSRHGELSTAARTAATRRSTTASTCGCRAASSSTGATSISTST